MRKNTTGQYVAFQAISKTDGSDVITGTPVVYYTIDGGTQAQTTATAVHEGNGQWSVALSQAETNGDHIVFSFVLTGAVTQTVNVYTIDADLTNLDVAVSTRSTVAATDIVSGGAITTSGGAVSNVTLVATTTTNSDMRGTDSSFLAASAPANFGSLSINSSGHIARVTLVDTTTTNTDMVDVSGLATSADLSTVDANVDAILVDTGTTIPASIAALNDISAADVWTYSTRTITSGGITQAEVAAAVWNASLSGYNTGGSTGKALKQIKEGVISTDGSVDDTSATTTTFVSNLNVTTDGFYHDKILVFISGDLLGQARHIETYSGSTKAITVSVPLTSAPSDGDEFLILATHEHSLSEISEAVWSDTKSSYTTDGTFGYYLDAQVSSISAGGGEGIYTLTVTVKDADDNLISGARVNISGTLNTVVSNSAGQAIFNVDSGTYTLVTSPPSGYQSPANVEVTVSANASQDIVVTATSAGTDAGWLG